MSMSPNHEIVQGYIEEVRTYIPSLTQGLGSLRQTLNSSDQAPENNEILEETHRLVHTIKGASAMVGIYGLSHIACQMEDALEDILSGELKVSEDTFRVMTRTVEHFQTYCSEYFENGVPARTMLKETVLEYRRMRGLPPEQDATILEKLSESVPEQEGYQIRADAEEEPDEETDIPDPEADSDSPDSLMEMLSTMSEVPEDESGVPEDESGVTGDESGVTGDGSDESPDALTEMLNDMAGLVPGDDSLLPADGMPATENNHANPQPATAPDESESLMAMLDDISAGTEDTSGEDVPEDPDDPEALIAMLDNMSGEDEPEDPFQEEDEAESESHDSDNRGSRFPPEILEGFYEEAKEHLQNMEVALKRLGAEITEPIFMSPDYKAVIGELRRSVHTLRGAGAVIGLSNLSGFAQHAEDFLEWLYETGEELSPDIVSVLSESSKLLADLMAHPEAPETSGTDALKAVFKKIREGQPLPPSFPLGKDNDPPLPGGDMSSADGGQQATNREPGTGSNQESADIPQPASDIPPELLESFYEEAEEHLQDMGRALNTLESEIEAPCPMTPDHKELIRQIRRSVHTLKGAGAVIGLSNLSGFAHSAEDLLDWLYETAEDISPEIISVLTDSADLMESLVANPRDPRTPEADALKAEYLKITGSAGGAGQLSPAPEPEPATREPEPESDIPPELLESFYEEAEEHLQDMGRALNTLESEIQEPGPVSDAHKELIRQIRRSVHTLKGAGAVIGLSNLSGFAHSAEDLLDWLYETAEDISPEIISVLTDSADLLESLVANPRDPRTPEADVLKAEYLKITGSAGDAGQLSPAPEPEPATREPEPESDIPAELLESFYEEAEEHLQDMGRALNTLESEIQEPGPVSDAHKELIRQIRRSVHTLKGAGAVIGLSNLSGFAHSAEDLLDWLYETSEQVSPDIISVLTDSADLLERLVANPGNPRISEADALREQYQRIMKGAPLPADDTPRPPSPKPQAPNHKPQAAGHKQPASTVEEFPAPGAPEEKAPELPVYQTRTLRVGMERIDELINLVGELIIATSAFDQKMDRFVNALNELELSRDRLREVAKDMEVGYEVKALGSFRDAKYEVQDPASETYARSESRDPNRVPKSEIQNATSEFQNSPDNRQETTEFDEFDSLELDQYSALNLIIRTLNESVIDVGAINTQLSNIYSDFDGHLTRQQVILSELQDKMMRVRMTQMALITGKLRRTVREVASRLGKKIRLVIRGENIELDRVIWEKMTDPLMHILRNAADHGIEPPELRQALGKPPVATVELSAEQEGNQVVIRVSDDGTGLNYEAIRNTARKAGISGVDEMSEDALAGLIFHPGFSTRGKISEVSGRGVGMDVVRQNILDMKGSVRVASHAGKGTRFTIRIPLTLSVMRGLLFTVSNLMFAIGLNEVKEILRVDPADISGQVENVVRIGDRVLPICYLSELPKHKTQNNKTQNNKTTKQQNTKQQNNKTQNISSFPDTPSDSVSGRSPFHRRNLCAGVYHIHGDYQRYSL
jgi:chemosensory pili system protein ChpA (sensor histidine kinase/response regulator)